MLRAQSFKLLPTGRLDRPQEGLEIILIDNNSTNESNKKLNSYKLSTSGYKVILNKTNVGFAKACNQGAQIAKGKWLLFLNPDTLITSDEILKFVKSAEKQNLDAASPTQTGDSYYKPLPTWFSLAVEFSPLGRIIPLSAFKKRTLFGGCLLIKASALKKLGGWDERFFLWFEDSDLTKRLYDMKYKIGWLPVKYKHSGGSSFVKLDFTYKRNIFFESLNIYARKHFNLGERFIVKLLTTMNKR